MSNVDRAQVLQHAEQHGSAAAAQRYGVSPATVRSWRHRAGATATPAEPEATPAVKPGPPDWPTVEIEAELLDPAGHAFPEVTDPGTGISRAPQVTVRAPQVPAGVGRSIQTLGDGQFLRLPLGEAAELQDGQVIACGNLGFRIMGRRSASLDRNGGELTLDKTTREKLARLVLLRIEPARVREPADAHRARMLAHRQQAIADAARRVRQGEDQRRQTRPDSIPGLPTRQPGGF